jgi:hypothetical protein
VPDDYEALKTEAGQLRESVAKLSDEAEGKVLKLERALSQRRLLVARVKELEAFILSADMESPSVSAEFTKSGLVEVLHD